MKTEERLEKGELCVASAVQAFLDQMERGTPMQEPAPIPKPKSRVAMRFGIWERDDGTLYARLERGTEYDSTPLYQINRWDFIARFDKESLFAEFEDACVTWSVLSRKCTLVIDGETYETRTKPAYITRNGKLIVSATFKP